MGLVYDNSLTAFLIVTLLLGGGAAWLTGRALAQAWRPIGQLICYAALLALPAALSALQSGQRHTVICALSGDRRNSPYSHRIVVLSARPDNPDGNAVSVAL